MSALPAVPYEMERHELRAALDEAKWREAEYQRALAEVRAEASILRARVLALRRRLALDEVPA